jgi:anti-anti-sigma factor
MRTSDPHFDIHVDCATRQIALSGELDAATAPRLAAAVEGLRSVALGDITVRLDDVTFIGASGLGAVVSARCVQADSGAVLTLTGANEDVRRMFLIGKLADLLQP